MKRIINSNTLQIFREKVEKFDRFKELVEVISYWLLFWVGRLIRFSFFLAHVLPFVFCRSFNFTCLSRFIFLQDFGYLPYKQSTKSTFLGPPFVNREPLKRNLHAFYLSGLRIASSFLFQLRVTCLSIATGQRS